MVCVRKSLLLSVLLCLDWAVFSVGGNLPNIKLSEMQNSQLLSFEKNSIEQNKNLKLSEALLMSQSVSQSNSGNNSETSNKSSQSLGSSLNSMKTNLETLSTQFQELKQQYLESQKTSKKLTQLLDDATLKIDELISTNEQLIANLTSNKDTTDYIVNEFGQLYSEYENIVLLRTSLEMQVASLKKSKVSFYSVSGVVCVAGIGAWVIGKCIDSNEFKYVGAGLAIGGGLPICVVSVMDLVNKFRR